MNKRINYMLLLFACICILTISNATAYEYSVTTIEDYVYLADLDPHGEDQYEIVEQWLHDEAGWSEEFYDKDSSVTAADFGTSDTGYTGLDGADFHYHFGHGMDDIGTELALSAWLPGFYNDVTASDVKDKWDQDNEWVMFHSCYVLDDRLDWSKALDSSHGIMGFSTATRTSTTLIDEFFEEAIDNDELISDSYYHATKAAFQDDVRAVIISDTSAQMSGDHLNGQGSMAADESPNDSSYSYLYWWC